MLDDDAATQIGVAKTDDGSTVIQIDDEVLDALVENWEMYDDRADAAFDVAARGLDDLDRLRDMLDKAGGETRPWHGDDDEADAGGVTHG